MFTSYFAKNANHKNAVSISGKCPEWYKGKEFKKLAPKFWFFAKYKADHDEAFYTEQYKNEVLSMLNPNDILKELGEDAVLLCYEKPGDFCHRHLVSQWLNENGIKCSELK
jgi:hypothetical protein